MYLSEQVKIALDYIQSIDVSDIDDTLDASRIFYEKFIPMAGEKETIYKIENLEVPSFEQKINIRIYRPSNEKKLPVVIYFHGGWFNAGGLESHDKPLRKLAKLSGAILISVDYRLAPEYPFPIGLNDCYNALEWIVLHAKILGLDLKRMAIAGDSAGGALATVITRRAIKNNLSKILCQALIYPVTDASLQTPSWQEFKDGPVLNYEGAVHAWNLYLPNIKEIKNPDVSPLYADGLSDMPSTLIIIAEYDPLRDEAILYAEKLQKSGVTVQQSLYKGMVHGFFQMGGIIEDGSRAIGETAQFLIQNFNK